MLAPILLNRLQAKNGPVASPPARRYPLSPPLPTPINGRETDLHPASPLGGIARGWPAIRAVYQRIFEGKARVHVEFHDYTLHEAGDMFYAVGRERGALERDGLRLEPAIRTSRLFRRIDGAWRQVHHHGSFDDAALLAAYQEAVR